MRLPRIVILLSIAVAPYFASAQRDSVFVGRHSLSISAGGGLHSLNPSISGSVSSNGLRGGGFVSLNYDFLISNGWSVGTGVGLSSYSSETETTEKIVTKNAIDKDGESYTHTLSLKNLAETQKASMLEIPFRATYHTAVSPRAFFEVGAQAHILLTVKDKYETSSGTVTTTGDYPQYNLHFDSDMPENGFYSVSPYYTGAIGLRHAGVGIGANIGLAYRLGPKISIALSLYGKYTITDMSPKSKSAQQYNPDCLSADGYSPSYESALATTNCTELHPLAIGLNASFRLSFGGKKSSAKPTARPSDTTSITKTQASQPTISVAQSSQQAAVHETQESSPVESSSVAASPIIEKHDSVSVQIEEDIQTMIDSAGGIRFDLGSGSLEGESAATVARIADLLNSHPKYSIKVTGHTCDMGTPDVNHRIGMDRAEAVAQCLERNGVDDSRIHVFSAGDTQPIAPNDTEAHRQQNRRVKITVYY